MAFVRSKPEIWNAAIYASTFASRLEVYEVGQELDAAPGPVIVAVRRG
jgi:hypothetical protein